MRLYFFCIIIVYNFWNNFYLDFNKYTDILNIPYIILYKELLPNFAY